MKNTNTQGYVEYRSNNSGGIWWLKDSHWHKLEKAGWVVAWCALEPKYKNNDYVRDSNGIPKLVAAVTGGCKLPIMATKDSSGTYRWLGAAAKTAYRPGLPLMDAVKEWERVTGLDSTAAGCPCCGNPHNFTEYTKKGEFVAEGPETRYIATWGED